jgi:superfamily II DNA or RNA helicase
MSRTFFTEFTKEQTKVLEWFEEHIDEPELTLNLPTGFGKSLMICETMKQFGRVMIVFPTLTLMDTFYKKYQAYFDKPTLFICTENKDIKSFQKETGHDFESLQGKQSKKALKETVEEQIIPL